MAAAETQQRRAEVPKYRLTETAYLNERLYVPDEQPLDMNADPLDDGTQPRKPLIIAFAGIPAHYMEPVNDAARAMCEKHKDRMSFRDPINELTIVTPEPAQAKA